MQFERKPAERIVLGTRKGLIFFRRKRGEWQLERVAHAGIPVSYAAVDARTGTHWACLDHGHWGCKLARSGDAGASWEEVAAPAYPEGEIVKEGVPAKLRYAWVLTPGGVDEPERLYLGTEPGGLFASDDGGRSFRLVESLWRHPTRIEQWMGGGRDQPGLHSIWIDPRDSAHLWIAISCAGVFESRDRGASWEARNRGQRSPFLPDPEVEVGTDPHFVQGCASAPDVLWQQNHVGIYRSEDGGGRWTEVSQEKGPARFGFAIAADPADPRCAYVVPADSDEKRIAVGGGLLVCRTRDAGASWQELRTGLPQSGCFDVVLRHALDLSGNDLAFASTTGNLYASSDVGESWACIGNHLPPVYSVRFA